MPLKCTLYGCNEKFTSAKGFATHERGHIVRGEATAERDPNGGLAGVPGVPIARTQYARTQRMSDIRAGKVKADLPRRGKRKPKPEMLPVAVSIPSAPAVFSLPTIPASQRMKEAVVFFTVAEMLESNSADAVLFMLNQVKELSRHV